MTRPAALALIVLLGLGAPALGLQSSLAAGCGRAACDAPPVVAAEAAMQFAERGLAQELSLAERSALQSEGATWRRARDASCGAETGAATTRCLVEETEARTRMLESGGRNRDPKAPQLRPTFVREARPGQYETDIVYPQITGTEGAAALAFNKAAHDLILGDTGLMGEFRSGGNAGAPTSNSVFYDIPYLGPRLVTVVFWLISGSGRLAHPFVGRESLVFDLQLGRGLAPEDALVDPAQAAVRIAALCRAQLAGAARVQDWRPAAAADATAVVANFRNWAPGPLALDILFDPGTVAAEASGLHTCRLDYAALLPMLKLRGPLPPG
jgi:hypothetical protein